MSIAEPVPTFSCNIANIVSWRLHATPRVVLDTSILVTGIRNAGGASRALLRAALEGRYRPLASTALLLEYESALLRPEHLKHARVVPRDAIALLDAYAASSEYVHIHFPLLPIAEDPNDDTVLETAVNGSATMIVTFDRAIQRAPSFGILTYSPQSAARKLRLGI